LQIVYKATISNIDLLLVFDGVDLVQPDAREQIRLEIRQLEKQIEARRRALALLDEADGEATEQRWGTEFVGLDIAAAIVKYLRTAPGQTADIETQVLPELIRGGAELGKSPDRYSRNLKIAVSMNSKKPEHPLEYDAAAGTVSLRYPQMSAAGGG
jgi:hypothetical protein